MYTIAGVTGRTGRAVAEALLARGASLRVLMRKPAAEDDWRHRGVDVAIADLLDTRTVTDALRDCEGLFALLPDDLSAPDFHGHRRRMADALAASVRAAHVPHVVLLSSVTAAAPAGPGRGLRYAEQALAQTGCKLTVIRASFFQDNAAAALPIAQQHGMFASFFASPHTAVPMVAIADVAALVAACLLHPPERSETVALLGPAYTSAQIAEQLGEAIGAPLDVVTIPPLAQVDFLQRIGMPPQFAAALVEMYASLGADPPQHHPRVLSGATTLAETIARLTRPPRRPERTSIPAVVAAMTDAWNRHDLPAMGALYREDADFVNIFGGHLRGRDEIVREHTERHKVMFATARMAHTAPVIRALTPTVSLARVAWTMHGITGADGRPAADRQGLMLHVLELVDGEWSIVTTQNTELAHDAPRRFLDMLAAS